jgi:hypothetical protein
MFSSLSHIQTNIRKNMVAEYLIAVAVVNTMPSRTWSKGDGVSSFASLPDAAKVDLHSLYAGFARFSSDSGLAAADASRPLPPSNPCLTLTHQYCHTFVFCPDPRTAPGDT